MDDLVTRFRQLQRFVGWTADDEDRLETVHALLAPHLGEMVDDFYAAIVGNEVTAKVIAGGEAQIERLKKSLANWLEDVLGSRRDDKYVLRRWQIGKMHVRIGLDQLFVHAAMTRLRVGFLRLLDNASLAPAQRLLLVESVARALDLDLAMMEDAYQAEFLLRRMPANQARLQQQRVVADVGRRALETDDLDTLLEFVVAVTAETLKCDQCVVLRLLPDNQLKVRASFGLAPAQGMLSLTPGGQISQALLSGHRCAVSDARNASAPSCSELQPATDEANGRQMQSSVVTCIHGERWPWGVLIARSELADDFQQSDLDFVDSIANTLSIAVRHDQAAKRGRQQERLAGIGEMMTGLAHESRNALQRIQACTEMLSFEVAPDSEAARLTHRIEAAQDDLTRLLGEVRNYAAPIQLDKKHFRLTNVWRQTWDELSQSRPPDAQLTEHLSTNDKFYGDPFQLRQVFRILFENSFAAGATRITVNMEADERSLLPTAGEGRSMTLRVRVQDDGAGVPESMRQRVFEPFFTTSAKGTGLGLSICRRIVEAHHGAIRLESPSDHDDQGVGATFVMELPL
ncbi:MAG: GAF domain-containing protein [Planctomycetales bacterium]|nr:GAF domain-containing protein [Planctomycetales bacterium]